MGINTNITMGEAYHDAAEHVKSLYASSLSLFEGSEEAPGNTRPLGTPKHGLRLGSVRNELHLVGHMGTIEYFSVLIHAICTNWSNFFEQARTESFAAERSPSIHIPQARHTARRY